MISATETSDQYVKYVKYFKWFMSDIVFVFLLLLFLTSELMRFWIIFIVDLNDAFATLTYSLTEYAYKSKIYQNLRIIGNQNSVSGLQNFLCSLTIHLLSQISYSQWFSLSAEIPVNRSKEWMNKWMNKRMNEWKWHNMNETPILKNIVNLNKNFKTI